MTMEILSGPSSKAGGPQQKSQTQNQNILSDSVTFTWSKKKCQFSEKQAKFSIIHHAFCIIYLNQYT